MNTRIIEIDDDTHIEIIQDSSFGYAGEVWDAALVLNHFLINKNNKHKFNVKDKVILELGAGTGSCGLLSAVLGAKKVYLTDKEENLEILKKNYELSKNVIASGTQVEIVPLDWSKKDDYFNIKETIDLIICSELVWNVNYFDGLIRTLDHFCTPNHTEIIMAYQYRQKSDMDFFNRLKEINMVIERIPESWLDEEYRAEDIFLVIIRKFS